MKESSEEPNVALIRSKSNYFQYSKKGLPEVSTVRNNDFFFPFQMASFILSSHSGLTTLMHVSIWRKSFVLQLLGKYNQARKSTKFDPTVRLAHPKG